MSEQTSAPKSKFSADWLLRGALTKIGDSFDRLTGRRWVPSSSLAASELIERIKRLLDAEVKDVPGKGKVVPHNIQLKMQWNKFAEGDAIETLRTELLTATIDHINDSLYYTEAPVSFEIKPDYFIEGVKLYVSFNKFVDEEIDVGQNITIPAINVTAPQSPTEPSSTSTVHTYVATYEINGKTKQTTLIFPVGQRRSVGRTGSSELALDDASISKIHASLVVSEDGSLSIADTGSTNGTFINDTRIAYGKAMRLEKDDRVKFGLIEVNFELAQKPDVPVMNDMTDGETTDDDMSVTINDTNIEDVSESKP
ncbi:MAG: FHA domain-containing protein [Chloracidobacterium sp.]|nr:FHA domain-containing protein [Chloracidobacterium sp.]